MNTGRAFIRRILERARTFYFCGPDATSIEIWGVLSIERPPSFPLLGSGGATRIIGLHPRWHLPWPP